MIELRISNQENTNTRNYFPTFVPSYLRVFLPSCLPIFVASCLLLSACGFSPVHATRSNGAAPRLSQIEVVSQKGRYGELLKAELQDLLDPDHSIRSKQYRLVIALETISNPLVIEQDGTASRIRIDFRSPYTLTRLADGALIKQGTLKRTHSYSVSEFADYASVIAERDVTRRGVEALARDYAQRLGGLLQ